MFLIIRKISNIIVFICVFHSLILASQRVEIPLRYNQLNGWDDANVVDSFNHYIHVAKTLKSASQNKLKEDLKRLDRTSNYQIKQFLEQYFEPILITQSETEHLLTGYHIFQAEARRIRSDSFSIPIYTKPKKKADRHHTHQAILNGVLNNKNLELAWLKDSVDVYLLMMQGSGVLTYADGSTEKVVYAGANGFAYKSISAFMLEKKLISPEQRNGPFIKAYLKKDLVRAREIIVHNPSYVFFKKDDTQSFYGAAGTPLKAMISLAVDTRYYPFHSLFWLESPSSPRSTTQLVVSQDTGGAIKGPQRGDLFYGVNKQAEVDAGLTKDENLRLIMLRLRS